MLIPDMLQDLRTWIINVKGPSMWIGINMVFFLDKIVIHLD